MQGEEWFRLVLILGMLLVVFFICLSLSLLSIRVYVLGEIQVQQILVDSQKREGGELRIERIRELNSDITKVSSFYTKRILLSDIVARVSSALPESGHLSSFSYTSGASKAKISLKGFALRTEDLLQIRTNLEQDPLFGNFHFPPSNWVRATNIDFAFDFEI